MQRAISLAKMAGGETRPNPLVGAVIVKNGEIIGEGYHARAGEAHAEVNALNNCKSRDMVRGADIYVSLEPCSHWGKTPPCAEMIVREGFKRVIIGTLDTSSKVSGKGVEILEKGGCEVLTGILEDECREVNKRFFTWHEKGRPYIILKWAKSKDGYIDLVRSADTPCGPNWITGIEERVLVHKWRSEEHSVMIGENTLVNDDPTLDVRYWKGFNPVRVIVSGSRKVPGDFKVLNDGKGAIFFTPYPGKAINGIEQIEISRGKNSILQVLKELHNRELQSVLVEGGSNLLTQFIDSDLWDEARIFTGQAIFGGGLKSPEISGEELESVEFDTTILKVIKPM